MLCRMSEVRCTPKRHIPNNPSDNFGYGKVSVASSSKPIDAPRVNVPCIFERNPRKVDWIEDVARSECASELCRRPLVAPRSANGSHESWRHALQHTLSDPCVTKCVKVGTHKDDHSSSVTSARSLQSGALHQTL